jgi:glutamine amidotransferase
MVHPIIDQYYSYNPYHSRSSKYVQDKGLVTNEKGATNGTNSTSPSTTPDIPHIKSTNISPVLSSSMASTLVPSVKLSALSPATENASNEYRPLSCGQAKESWKPQEVGNTKKKRVSLAESPRPDAPPPEPESPPTRASYGDPNKIAQYFPELHSGF